MATEMLTASALTEASVDPKILTDPVAAKAYAVGLGLLFVVIVVLSSPFEDITTA